MFLMCDRAVFDCTGSGIEASATAAREVDFGILCGNRSFALCGRSGLAGRDLCDVT